MPLVWTHRWLLLNLTVRELRARYLSGLSGLFWVLVNPLALLAIYAYVFTVIFQARFPEAAESGFVSFLAVALWPWLAFSESLQRATPAIRESADLVGKVAFPRELLIQARVLAVFFTHGIGYLLVLLVLKATGAPLHLAWLPGILVLFLILMVFALGLSLLLATLQVFFRDVQHVLPPLLMIWFFMTPILYPSSLVPERLAGLLAVNPLTWYVSRARDLLLSGSWPVASVDVLWISIALLALGLGTVVFRRCSGRFQDFL